MLSRYAGLEEVADTMSQTSLKPEYQYKFFSEFTLLLFASTTPENLLQTKLDAMVSF